VIALSVAAVLAVFILYTSVAGAGTPQLQPSDLVAQKAQQTDVLLVGRVVGNATGDAHAAGGLHFVLRDAKGSNNAVRMPVSYTGTVPDLFRQGREVVVEGTLRKGTFVAKPGTLSTKCPSKYAPAKKT
jgi:cytochrome c-type biogenesis protein CcmE